jgi:signal peptidase I
MLRPADPESKATSPPRTIRPSLRSLFRWIERGLAVFGGLVIVYWLTLDLSVIVSPSMQPTLQGMDVESGDRVITEKVSYWFRKPRRWEVITFITPLGEKRMKRVVGLPGETVQIPEPGKLTIDGKPIELPATLNVRYLRFGNLIGAAKVPCKDGYYLLGDDLKDSDDSRFNGPTPAKDVMGRAWLIVSPWSRVGRVK